MSDDPQGEVERVARAIYERYPQEESGEYVDGFLVTPGGVITWAQACKIEAEFGAELPAGHHVQNCRADARAAIAALRPSAGAGEIEALRTPADFSREFAGYMAAAAERYCKAVNLYHKRLLDEGLVVNFTDAALTDAYTEVFGSIYEWRKREAVALASLTAPAPGVQTEALTNEVERALDFFTWANIKKLDSGEDRDWHHHLNVALDHGAALSRHIKPEGAAALPAPGVREAMEFYAASFGCHAGRDGECNWSGCPQTRDGEPIKTGRHCPRDIVCGDPSCQAVEGAESAVRARLSSLPAAGKTRGTE